MRTTEGQDLFIGDEDVEEIWRLPFWRSPYAALEEREEEGRTSLEAAGSSPTLL